MNFTVNDIARSITGRSTVEECSIESLQQLAGQYPSFAPAQLLLADKLKTGDPALFEKQAQRASLHFANPLWLDYLLKTNNAIQTTPNIIENSRYEPPIAAELETPATTEEVVVQSEEELVLVDETDNQEKANSSDPPLRMPEFKIEPINAATAELVFEPYHTVDYFASQGIRAREEEKPKDQFSQQLKSFTEWLKTMKRLPVSEIASASTASDERKVEQMAQHSISDREVITEAMAEVWEKQGDNEKAINVYKKLSLLDPGKSSYFAAKIEQLKH